MRPVTGVRFPNACARCTLAPPTTTWHVSGFDYEISPTGQRIRLEHHVDVPVCAKCRAS